LAAGSRSVPQAARKSATPALNIGASFIPTPDTSRRRGIGASPKDNKL
jgi:hypothetical protein